MIRALLLDMDGTLYDQGALRRRILLDLLRTHVTTPFLGYRTARALKGFRNAQEALRSSDVCGDIAALQLQLACRQSSYSPTFVSNCVREWMEDAPLRYLPGCMPPAVPELLKFARSEGIGIALCSDYPAVRKLDVMGLVGFFDQVICAQHLEIGSLKPNPRILKVALELLGAMASEALYAGDRPEVDGAAAARAGIGYVHIVHRPSGDGLTIAGLLEKIKAMRD